MANNGRVKLLTLQAWRANPHRNLQCKNLTLPEALAALAKWRKATDTGSSHFQEAILSHDGAIFGYVSYNGRVWNRPSSKWKPGDTPLYEADGRPFDPNDKEWWT